MQRIVTVIVMIILEQFRRKPMRFFWGNDMALLIKDIRQRIHREKDILGKDIANVKGKKIQGLMILTFAY